MTGLQADTTSPSARVPPGVFRDLPLTKFRAPRLRDDTVLRPSLLERLNVALRDYSVVLVSAPAGSGKSTLLAQLAAQRQAGSTIVWISLDADDDDANALFGVLVEALLPLDLRWESDPRQLIANVTGTSTRSRTALASLVNALCTSNSARIIIVLDDLHRLASAETYGLLETLIERLPDHVTLVFGTRVEPNLPLARWRAHGELAEFALADLRFTAADAQLLARSRAGEGFDENALAQAVAQTDGWAAGLSMLIHADHIGSSRGLPRRAVLRRNLFPYLADEILSSLTPDLRDFALRSAVLAELSADACRAVTGREDSAALIDELYRRNLFATVIDDSGNVLRLHDLFRDFLEAELSKRMPVEVAELHARAARAERCPSRAIHHSLKAGCWPEAVSRILERGESLLAEGGIATLERWIDQIPVEARASSPRISYLRGACAWLRWDWVTATRELTAAFQQLTNPADATLRLQAGLQLVDALSSCGDLELANTRLAQIEGLPTDRLGRAEIALLKAWCAAPAGEIARVGEYLTDYVDLAELDPHGICPVTVGRVHCMLIGLPGVARQFQRLATLCDRATGAVPAPWQLAALAVQGWAGLWRGDRPAVERAIARSESLFQQFGGIRLVAERLGQLKSIHTAAVGRHKEATTVARRYVEGLNAPEVGSHRAVWQRAYAHAFARMHWIADDVDGHDALLPLLTGQRSSVEWPFLDVAADVARGHSALLHDDPASAIEPLERAVSGYERARMPGIFADPRLALAYARVALGDPVRAWAAFEPVYRDAVDQGALGPLLLDSRVRLGRLLDSLPPAIRNSTQSQTLRRTLAAWAGDESTAAHAPSGPLESLTEREREVLAEVAGGSSNKHIARALDLSLHTVKRHVANILDKLDCSSRGQAADLFRRNDSPASVVK